MKTIIWKGLLYNSLEYFQISEIGDTFFVKSKIIGTYDNQVYFVEYVLNIDKEWNVSNFNIEFEINGKRKKITAVKNKNEWNINGDINIQFTDIDFIDISLSPFTNTLPIRRLKLNGSQEIEIKVIYIDILNGLIKPVNQKYKRNNSFNYKYKNIPNDFEADIDVDEFGLVTFYPALFERVTS